MTTPTTYEDLLTPAHLDTIGRVRQVCTVAGLAGAAASMAANMLASDGTAVGLAVGIIAPGAFILASEIATAASSLPRTRGTGALLATLAVLLLLIAGAAAVVSFGHLREVVASVGESPLAEVLIAIVVDAVAVMGLVGHRLTSVYLRRHETAVAAKAEADRKAAALAAVEAERAAAEAAEREQKRAARAATRASKATKAKAAASNGQVAGDDPSLDAAERARAIKAANPAMTRAEIGAVIGKSERMVRRYLATPTPTDSSESAGAEPDANEQTDNETQGRRPGLVVV